MTTTQPDTNRSDMTQTEMTTETVEGMKTMKTIASVKGLHKRYQLGRDNYVDALRGASVNVGAGEMVAIMGPSGCGKSTMLHMMGCLDEPDSGEVWLNGRRVDDLSTRATTKVLREEIGFIFQGFNLVSTMTALAVAAHYSGKSWRSRPRPGSRAGIRPSRR
jgi:ABC-type lipoprotein export system ATPase subunit